MEARICHWTNKTKTLKVMWLFLSQIGLQILQESRDVNSQFRDPRSNSEVQTFFQLWVYILILTL